MSMTKKTLQHHNSFGIWTLITLFSYFTLITIMPLIETRFLPVVGNFTITSLVEVPDGIIVSMTAPKFRNCTHEKTIAYIGRRDRSTGARIYGTYYEDPPEERFIGTLTWKGFFIPVNKFTFLNSVYIDTLHTCFPWVWYQTRSHFYPKE